MIEGPGLGGEDSRCRFERGSEVTWLFAERSSAWRPSQRRPGALIKKEDDLQQIRDRSETV